VRSLVADARGLRRLDPGLFSLKRDARAAIVMPGVFAFADNVMTPLAVGATAAHPDLFPAGLGIGRRGEPRKQYLGLVVTRPDVGTLVLGLNYFDTVDDGDNEDIYRLDSTTFEVTSYMRSFETDYPESAGHHWVGKALPAEAAGT
jgi:hypothetical protein